MAAISHRSFSPTIAFLSSTHSPTITTTISQLNFFRPTISSSQFPRLRICQSKAISSANRSYRLLAVSGLVDGNSEAHPDAEPFYSIEGGTIDIKLPRRSLLVQFTCNECGDRTQRLINRHAYERGLVFVQCAGCERYHKLVDNLGLIVEYDLREETSMETDTDQVE